jgi:GDP-L-fucose synthase
MNLGSGREITIRDLTVMVAQLARFEGEIHWDATKPDGQPRRCLDVSRAFNAIGFRARTPLEDGLRKTVEWYEHWQAEARAGDPESDAATAAVAS